MHRPCWNAVGREKDAPPKTRRKSRFGDAEMRYVLVTRGDDNDSSKDPMKVEGDTCSKSKGAIQQQWKDRKVSTRLEQSMPMQSEPDGAE